MNRQWAEKAGCIKVANYTKALLNVSAVDFLQEEEFSSIEFHIYLEKQKAVSGFATPLQKK